MDDEQLLGEVEDLIRSMPERGVLREARPESLAWLGRVSAVIDGWNKPRTIPLQAAIAQFQDHMALKSEKGFKTIVMLLYQAQHDLRMKTVGPVNTAIDSGSVFDYFDEVRKIVESATTDILFVDPYLDAEFVSRYLPNAKAGVSIRLLGRKSMQTLLPAVEALAQQTGANVEVRHSTQHHDRYLLVDGARCYQSGASFKDGAKKSPTTLTQISDAFDGVKRTYEEIWANATVHR